MILIKKCFVILLGLIVFKVSLYTLEISLNEETEEEDIVEQIFVPQEVMLPNLTLTDEMKVKMFFEDLRIDLSVIKPKEIAECISPWELYIKRYAAQYGVDTDLVRAIIYAESKGDPFCISKKGAQGLMQIMPSTADFMGISDMLNPEKNIKVGVKYIAWLIKRYDEQYLLWAWNAGPGSLRKNFLPLETKKFIVEVLTLKTYLINEKNKTKNFQL